MTLIDGLKSALKELIKYLPEIINTIVDVLTQNLSLIIKAGLEILMALLEGITDNLGEILDAVLKIAGAFLGFVIENLDDILEAGSKILDAVIDGILNNLGDIIDAAIELIDKIFDELTKDDNLGKILNAGITILSKVAQGIINAIPKLVERLPEVFDAVFKAFNEVDWLKLGVDLIKAVGRGVLSMGGALWDATDTVFNKAYDRIAEIFGLNKPEEEMLSTSTGGHGFAGGGKREGEYVQQKSAYDEVPSYLKGSALGMIAKGIDLIDPSRESYYVGMGPTNNLTGGGSGTIINVYGTEGQDVSELAEIVSQKIATRTRQERMAW